MAPGADDLARAIADLRAEVFAVDTMGQGAGDHEGVVETV
jgi:hypothetical protein